MKRYKMVFFSLSVFLISTTGCKKESLVSEVPSIAFVSMNPNPALKYQDEIKITISYTDGNGDLGENNPDVKNLFVTDSRNNVTYQFRIPQLAPDNSNIIIQGNLSVNLPPQGFINDADSTETTTYSIYVNDRAGNMSNTVQTNSLTIKQ